MQYSTFHWVRFLRFAVLGVLMLAAFLITLEIAPKRVVLVPCIFLALFVPIVLLPMRKR